ncbi:unnamed protein product [Caenorhabditis angaria]|uniref:Delta(3,5)-Delta(2,4)-dienoyl-CoA isomerase, mitochondrial n=1 Tax=Caenorhabditis angaria TaxID=860376 RepID=A0A9P1MW58_9PELO|nr:unnamed protein product [Caenorhabditis angaria]
MILSRFGSRLGLRAFSSGTSSDVISVVQENEHVAHIKLNRPNKLNTFTLDMWTSLKSELERLGDDPKCRAIVLSGEGKVFCAGIDLAGGMGEIIKVIQNDDIEIGRKARLLRRFIGHVQDCFTAVEKCPKPVIAAVHSHCIGAGIDLITACDIRFASQCSNFSIKEVDVGLAADVGTLNRIQKVVGNDSWTREIAMTARDFGVDEALKFGLISRIYPSKKETVAGAVSLAKTIAEKSPIAVQGTKINLNYSRDHTIDESLEYIKTWNMSQLLSTDLINSATAVMSKQKATFEDV